MGLTISDPTQFELAAKVNVVLFNKAGTLTQQNYKVIRPRLAYGSVLANQSAVLAIAAAAELESSHPIALAIVEEARVQKLELPIILDVRAIPGRGVSGVLDGESVSVGGPALLTERNIAIYVDDLVAADAANQLGHTVVYVVQNTQLIGTIELSDSVRPEAVEVVRKLHSMKIRVAMVTGDATGVAKHVAGQLGIAEVFAEVLPGQREDVVRKLKSDGSKVAVVGTRIKDLSALAEADVAIATEVDEDDSVVGLQVSGTDTRLILKTILLSKRESSLGVLRFLSISAGALGLLGLVLVAVGG